MRKLRPDRRRILPVWDMPSDPVKAVLWFMHWFLRILVRFFWILIIAGIIVEVILNTKSGGVAGSIVSGIITLLIGLFVWTGLGVLLFFLNIGSSVSQTFTEVNRMQRNFPPGSPFASFREREREREGRVVEGTVTDLDEERRKRRSE